MINLPLECYYVLSEGIQLSISSAMHPPCVLLFRMLSSTNVRGFEEATRNIKRNNGNENHAIQSIWNMDCHRDRQATGQDIRSDHNVGDREIEHGVCRSASGNRCEALRMSGGSR